MSGVIGLIFGGMFFGLGAESKTNPFGKFVRFFVWPFYKLFMCGWAPHAAHLSLPPFVTIRLHGVCASCVCGDRWMVDVKEQADSVPKWDICTGEALCFYLAEAYKTKYASLPQLPHPHHCARRLRPPPQHQPSRAHPPCPSHPSSRCARTQGGARQAHCHLLLLPRHGPHHHVLDSKHRR